VGRPAASYPASTALVNCGSRGASFDGGSGVPAVSGARVRTASGVTVISSRM